MRKFLHCLFLISVSSIYGQVGIGTDAPNTSSQLEIVSQNRGVLFPRVSLSNTTDQVTITAGNVESLLVYNTSSNADISPGYYYWFQGSWRRLLASSQGTGGDFSETITSLTDNGDGTYTYINEDGTETEISLIKAGEFISLVDNGDGTFELKDGLGSTIGIINTNANRNPYDNTNSGLSANTVQEAIDQLATSGSSGSGVILIDNGDGTVTLTAQDGTSLGSMDKATLTDNADGSYTFDNGNGSPVVFDTNAGALPFENSSNGFTSNNVQGAIEELKAQLDQTSDVLIDNQDGTYTHTAVDGTAIIIDANTTHVSVTDGVYTFSDGAGNTLATIDSNASSIGFDDTTSSLGAGNVQEAIDQLVAHANKGAGVSLVDNNDGTVTLVAEDGSTLGSIDKSSLTDNGDGSYTFDNGNGSPVVFDTNAGALPFENSSNGFTSNNVQGAIEELKTQLDQTSDVLIDNQDGTYTHTAVDGTAIIIDANTTQVSVTDGVYTFSDGAGNTLATIDSNASSIGFDDTTSSLGAGNVQEAINQLVAHANKGAGVSLVDNNDGTVTLVAEDGSTLGSIDKSSLTDNGDGSYTFDNGNGSPVVFDTNAGALPFENSSNGFAATDVQGAIEEVAQTIESNKGDLTVSEGIQFTSGDGADKLLADTGIGIADEGITTVKLNDGAVTNAKLGENAVHSSNIEDGAIAAVDLGTDSVTADKINSDVAGAGLIKDATTGALTVDPTAIATLADGDITSTDITVDGGDNASFKDVTLEIANGAITNDKLADGAVTNAKLGENAVHSSNIVDGAIAAEDLGGGSVTADKINSDVAGSGLTKDASTGALTVDPTAIATLADGDITSTDITVTGGENAAFNDVSLEIAEGAIDSSNIVDGAISAEDLGTDSVTADKINNDVAGPGLTKDASTGALTVDPTAIATLADGDITSTDITVTGGENAAFNNVTLEIADGAITHEKLADGAVSQQKLTSYTADGGTTSPASDGQVLMADGAGGVQYQNISGDHVSYNNTTGNLTSDNIQGAIDELADRGASNGLHRSGTDVILGGPLTEPTSIQTTAAETLAIEGLQTGTGNENIIVADPSSGILKQVSAVMPKFFYMPSVIIPTSVDHLPSGGTLGIMDLYQMYSEQFGGGGTPGLVKNSGSTTSLPVLDPNELDYYITWYDTSVFQNVTLSDDGVLNYDIVPGTEVTHGSFMNIVFAVK